MVDDRSSTPGTLTDNHRFVDEEESYFDEFYDQQGSIPGTLHIPPDSSPPVIVLVDYSLEKAARLDGATPEDCIAYLDTDSVSWVDVKGLGSEDILRRVGKVFNLHPLILEDIVNVPQRPKLEEYSNQLLIVARMVTPKRSGGFVSEQVSFILGKHYLLTVQEEADYDCFGPIRERIRSNQGIIRRSGPDYLTYTLLDSIIDGFFPVLEAYGEEIEDLENEVVANPTHQTLEKIHALKRELLALRRAIWPQRDMINSLIRDGSSLICHEVNIYLRDCYDHTIQVLDMVETYRELAASLMDIYLSSVSNKMNEIMKFLTIISSIFIPLTFIAGVYGMNFNTEKSPLNMPELNAYWGYPICLSSMLIISLALLYTFWRRGWFESLSTVVKDDAKPAKKPMRLLRRR